MAKGQRSFISNASPFTVFARPLYDSFTASLVTQPQQAEIVPSVLPGYTQARMRRNDIILQANQKTKTQSSWRPGKWRPLPKLGGVKGGRIAWNSARRCSRVDAVMDSFRALICLMRSAVGSWTVTDVSAFAISAPEPG